jgi:hypothetical protein
MEGIETLWAWVQKPGNFPRVDKVAVEELYLRIGLLRTCCPLDRKRCQIAGALNIWVSTPTSCMIMKSELQQRFPLEENAKEIWILIL